MSGTGNVKDVVKNIAIQINAVNVRSPNEK